MTLKSFAIEFRTSLRADSYFLCQEPITTTPVIVSPKPQLRAPTCLVEVFKTNPFISLFDCQASRGHSDDLWVRHAVRLPLHESALFMRWERGGKSSLLWPLLASELQLVPGRKFQNENSTLMNHKRTSKRHNLFRLRTDRNSALKKCSLRDRFTWRNEWCHLARIYNLYPAHLKLPFDI